MVRRSVLFTPGDRPEMMRKAPKTGADTIVFDLEDAVSLEQKATARKAVYEVLTDPAFDPACEVCVRVNPDPTADLEVLLGDEATDPFRLDALVLPKVTSNDDVETLVAQVAAHGRSFPVLALIESAPGVLAAPEIARVPATDALIFGAEDFATDIGATRTPDGLEVLYARQRVVVAAASAGCEAIDTVFTEFADEDGLLEAARVAREFGYDGKLAIHPAQVDPITRAFTPTEDELAWARRVLEAEAEADAAGRGVFEVDGEMIDGPLIERAKQIVARSEE